MLSPVLGKVRDLFKAEQAAYFACEEVLACVAIGWHTAHLWLISAAQVFTHLVTICHQRTPEHEGQVRPLIGLTPEQANAAWDLAVQKAGTRRVTEKLVKSAVRELGLVQEEETTAREPRQTRVQRRRLIDEVVGQLLVLLSQKAPHEVLTEKVEALHRHIQALFPATAKG